MTAEVEQRVCEATERLLRDGAPFTRLALRDIAGAAGIARSTFYVHFADKSDLLLRLAARTADDLGDAADGWWTHRRSEGDPSPTETMLGVIRAYRSHATVLAAVDEVAGFDPAVATWWRARCYRYLRRVHRRLVAEQRAGRLAADLDVATAAFIAVWSVDRAVSEHVRARGPADDPALAGALARFVRVAILDSRTAAA